MNTKEKIIKKYTELVLKKRTPDISVTELCGEIGICRKTFYRHFRDRYAITEEMFINDIEIPLRTCLRIDAKNRIRASGIEKFITVAASLKRSSIK